MFQRNLWGVAASLGICLGVLSCARSPTAAIDPEQTPVAPLFRVVDLDIDESAAVELTDGSSATVKLIAINETRDPVRKIIRRAEATVEVNGETAKLSVGNYSLPRPVGGVQIDCTVTAGYLDRAKRDYWSLRKAARLRMWPASSPWVRPDAFRYPLRQRWFAANTQLANEPAWVSGGDDPAKDEIYYHSETDIGGAEGLTEVVSATDGLVISAGKETINPDRTIVPYGTQYDYVAVLDKRGWFIRYIHLKEFDPGIEPGRTISMGDRIGLLGKEGASGGWSHLHFEIKAEQPSGEWGTLSAYPFLWQAYLDEYEPTVVAVARPHQLVRVGDRVLLDASKSWSASGEIASYEWMFPEGTTAAQRVERTYSRPGTYSEALKVTDASGAVSYDFAGVQVVDPLRLDERPPAIHAAYFPTLGIKPGDPVTFKVRTFETSLPAKETWDFGDGSPAVTTQSDGGAEELAEDGYAVTTHRYDKPGDYVVTVERPNEHGFEATARLHVHVEAAAPENPSAR